MRRILILSLLTSLAAWAQCTTGSPGTPGTLCVANASTGGGTSVNKLAKFTGSPPTAVITSTSDTLGALGVCTAGCGTSGNATIQQSGYANLVFDGGVTGGDYVIQSPANAGQGHDSGSGTVSPGQQIIGRVAAATNGCSSPPCTYLVELQTTSEGTGGSSGTGPTVQTNSANNASQALLNFTTPSATNLMVITPVNPSGGIEQFSAAISGATSGGMPYFPSNTSMASTGALAQYGIIYGGGAGNPPGVITPPATPASVPQTVSCTPGQACVMALPGVPIDVQSGATYTVATTDRVQALQTTNNTTSTAVTVPTATTSGIGPGFVFVHINSGSVVATDTPTTSTVDGHSAIKLLGQTSGGTPEGAFWYTDPSNNYWALEVLPTDANGKLQLGAESTNTVLLNANQTLTGTTQATTQTAGDSSTDLATDAFVSTAIANAVAAVNPAVAVLAATTGSNIVGTYSNGATGVGATFTVTATGTFSMDGVALGTVGQRALIKDQSSAFQNGVYTVTTPGSSGVQAVFTRASDYNQPTNINSTGSIPVQSGATWAGTTWVGPQNVVTVGTTAITFTQLTLPINLIAQISGTPTQYQLGAWVSGSALEGIGPGTQYQPLLSGGASGYPAYASYTLPATVVAGDIPYATSSSAITTLSAVGYSILGSGATNPVWITPSGNGQCLLSDPSNFATVPPAFGACPSGGGNVSSSGTPAAHQVAIWVSSSAIEGLAPSATSGVPLISQGSSADPAYGAIDLAGGSSIVTGTLPAGNLPTVTIAIGGTNATSAAAGTVPNATSGTASSWTATPTIGVQNTTQGIFTITGSASNPGELVLNIAGASANALTIKPGANSGGVTLTAGTTGGTIAASVNGSGPLTLAASGQLDCPSCVTTATGSITNSNLANDSITIAGTAVTLGSSTSSLPSPGAIGGTTPSTATFTSETVQNALSVGGTAYSYGAPSTTGAAALLNPATTYTVTGSSTTANFQANYYGAPTFSDASPGTVTDAFNALYVGPPVAAGAGPLAITRKHTLGVVDSTSASSSITGGLVIATTLGTSATSVGIGGGNINAGGSITGNTLVSGVSTGTAPLTVSSTTQVANLNAATLGGFTLGTPVAGGIGYGVSTTQVGTTSAGTAKQLVLSGGTSAPTMIDFPDVKYIPSANCVNTTAGSGWSLGASGVVTCRAGTNNQGGYVTITDTASSFAQFPVSIPDDWDTATNPYIRVTFASASDTTNGHTVIPQVKVSCPTAGNGTTSDDATFTAAQSLGTTTFGGSAVANGFYNSSTVQIGSTQMTGCIAGGVMIIQLGRATDTATGNINFYGATVTIPRLLVLQAN